MISATDVPVVQSGLSHVFNKVDSPNSRCELCQDQIAAFRWTKQEDQRLVKSDVPICRTCASMIILIGKEYRRSS
jgi:hypothetical protein